MKLRRLIYNYILFFGVVAFLVSCSMLLFVTIMADTLNLNLTSENISVAAKLTLGNIILLSALFTIIDAVRRKFTTEKITEHIASAAEKIVQGEFDVRIETVSQIMQRSGRMSRMGQKTRWRYISAISEKRLR